MKNVLSIKKLYSKNFKYNEEYKKVVWGSKNSMVNRHKLFFSILKKKEYQNWLDIGSGTGAIFDLQEKKKIKIKKKTGIELNKNLYGYIKKKKIKNLTLINKDIMYYKTLEKFDLISAIGILQNSGYSYKKVLVKLIYLMQKKSFLFITSKNILWEKMNGQISEKSGHEWINPLELARFLEQKGLKIIKLSGFIAHLNKIVKIKKSSTFFLYAKKK